MTCDTGDTGHVTGEYLLFINDNHLFSTVQTPSYNLRYTLYLVVLIAIHYKLIIPNKRNIIIIFGIIIQTGQVIVYY